MSQQQDILVCFPMRSEWDALHPPIEVPYPAPVVSSRQESAFLVPTPVLALAEFARENGWEVRVQYAQGYPPHASTGRPGALKDSIAVIFGGHPITDRRAYACYEKTAGGSAWTWNGIQISGPDVTPYAGCGVTELKEFLATPERSASAVAAWVRGIKAVRRAQAAAVKARPKAAAKPREGMS